MSNVVKRDAQRTMGWSPEVHAADLGAAKHVHKWQPCGMAVENHQFFDGITNPWARITLAIRSCECGAIRRTEVGRVYLRR